MIMKNVVIAVVALAVVAVSCANPTPAGGGGDGSIIDESISLTQQQAAAVSAACVDIAEALSEADTGRFVSRAEDIDATLSSIDGGDELRSTLSSIGNALPHAGDVLMTRAQLADIASQIDTVYGGLLDAGAADCQLVIEAAAMFLSDPPVTLGDTIDTVEEARAAWALSALDTYWMIVRFSGDEDQNTQVCGIGEVLVQVVDGVPESAVDRFFLCDIPLDEGSPIPLTVEGLIDLAESVSAVPGAAIDYDPDFGFPRQIFASDDTTTVQASVELTPGMAAERSEAVLEELGRQRATWAANGFDSYTFTVRNGCFCPVEWVGPFNVTVVDGAVVSVTRDGQDVTEFAAALEILTVDLLFDVIEKNADADHLEVIYNELGYPTLVNIDISFNTADEESYITVSDLLPTG